MLRNFQNNIRTTIARRTVVAHRSMSNNNRKPRPDYILPKKLSRYSGRHPTPINPAPSIPTQKIDSGIFELPDKTIGQVYHGDNGMKDAISHTLKSVWKGGAVCGATMGAMACFPMAVPFAVSAGAYLRYKRTGSVNAAIMYHASLFGMGLGVVPAFVKFKKNSPIFTVEQVNPAVLDHVANGGNADLTGEFGLVNVPASFFDLFNDSHITFELANTVSNMIIATGSGSVIALITTAGTGLTWAIYRYFAFYSDLCEPRVSMERAVLLGLFSISDIWGMASDDSTAITVDGNSVKIDTISSNFGGSMATMCIGWASLYTSFSAVRAELDTLAYQAEMCGNVSDKIKKRNSERIVKVLLAPLAIAMDDWNMPRK